MIALNDDGLELVVPELSDLEDLALPLGWLHGLPVRRATHGSYVEDRICQRVVLVAPQLDRFVELHAHRAALGPADYAVGPPRRDVHAVGGRDLVLAHLGLDRRMTGELDDQDVE